MINPDVAKVLNVQPQKFDMNNLTPTLYNLLNGGNNKGGRILQTIPYQF